jgi:hypothetical protein
LPRFTVPAFLQISDFQGIGSLRAQSIVKKRWGGLSKITALSKDGFLVVVC